MIVIFSTSKLYTSLVMAISDLLSRSGLLITPFKQQSLLPNFSPLITSVSFYERHNIIGVRASVLFSTLSLPLMHTLKSFFILTRKPVLFVFRPGKLFSLYFFC